MNHSVARCVVSAALVSVMGASVVGCRTPFFSAEDTELEAVADPDCSPEVFAATGPLDVALAIDTSQSTLEPAGFDVDEDGIVGEVVDSFYTDADDSWLAAIVKSVGHLLKSAEGHDIRFSLITFSGRTFATQAPPRRVILKRDAVIRIPLTDDIAELAAGVDAVLERGSQGMSNYFAGMRRATRSLLETEDRARASRRLVLFISDSPTPVLRGVGDIRVFSTSDPRLESSAREAIRERVVFNTFGLSEDALEWGKRPLGLIASATGGTYYPIEDASELYCHLASSLTLGVDAD